MNKRTLTIINLGASSAASILLAVAGMFVSTEVMSQTAPEAHTAAAVIAIDEQWSNAEDTGGANYVSALLLPEYRSINSDGSTHDRATIIAHALKNANTADRAAKAEKWRAAHPYLPVVEINGDVAIVTFVLQRGVDPKPVMSCDVFVYREGHWRALYSQHTEAGK